MVDLYIGNSALAAIASVSITANVLLVLRLFPRRRAINSACAKCGYNIRFTPAVAVLNAASRLRGETK